MSHVGIAREASAIWHLPLMLPQTAMPVSGPAEQLEVRLEAPDLCPRYCAQVFEIQVGPSPRWIAERLEAAGTTDIQTNGFEFAQFKSQSLGRTLTASAHCPAAFP